MTRQIHCKLGLVGLLVVCTAVADEKSSSVVEPGATVQKLATGMRFTEGPVWLPVERKVVFSDIPNSRWMQWDAGDGLSVFRPSEQANGNILDLQGRLISCQHAARNVVRIESDGRITVLADRFEGKRFNSPNDVAVRSDGTLWFTDPPWGLTGPHEIPGHWVFQLDPGTGRVEAVLKSLAMPNGIVFSPDERRLYVSDTGGHKRHPDPAFHTMPPGIHCYDMTPDGRIGKKRFMIPRGSDGMAVDVRGNVYATDGPAVQVYNADGKLLEQIPVPENPANVCFGDEDYKTLFITARTSLYRIRLKHPGANDR
jgi:gluconolactonase